MFNKSIKKQEEGCDTGCDDTKTGWLFDLSGEKEVFDVFNLKKIASLLVILALSCLLLSGCGNTQRLQQPDSQEDVSSQKEQQAENVDYPKRAINGVIAWAAGGATDAVSRVIAPLAESELGKPIVLSNMAGATGSIGTRYVYDQKADGYTLLFNAENPQLYKVLGVSDLDYNDFIPIVITDEGYGALLVPIDSPYDTVDDLISAAKENPGKLNLGLTGKGGLPHTSSLIFKVVDNIKFNDVSYDGDGPLITALIGKQIDATIVTFGNAYQYIKNGDIKALCVISNESVKGGEEIPALGQLKPEYQPYLKVPAIYHGVFVNKGTPEAIVEKLSLAFQKAVKDPRFIKFCQENLYSPIGLVGEEAMEYLNDWQAIKNWMIYDAGDAVESPETFGIPRPE